MTLHYYSLGVTMSKAATVVAFTSGPDKVRRHNPLSDDILATGPLRTTPKKRKARRHEDGEDRFVDASSSRKILKIGQDLAEEEQEATEAAKPNPAFAFESRTDEHASEDDAAFQDDDPWGDEVEDVVEEVVRLSMLADASRSFLSDLTHCRWAIGSRPERPEPLQQIPSSQRR